MGQPLPCEGGGKKACCFLGILQAAGEPGGGGTWALVTWPCPAQVPKATAQGRVRRTRVSSGAGGAGGLPVIETWGPPRLLQPRTGPIGSGGTAVINLLPLSSLSCLSVSSSWLSLCMWLPVLFTLPASAGRWGMSLKGYGSTLCHQAFVLLLLDHPPGVPGRGVSGPSAHPHHPPMKLLCHPEAPTSPL